VEAVRTHEARVTPGISIPRDVINGMASATVTLLSAIEERLGPDVDVWAEFARQLEQRRCQVAQPHERAPARPASPVVLH
jgi:hypothetical protein